MRTIYILLLLSLVLTKVHAQTDTDELLGAPIARNFIQLWPNFKEGKFFYSLDRDKSRKHYKSLAAGTTIGVPRWSREVTLTVRFFNPLQYTVLTTDTLLEDPSYANISKFATSLTDFLKLLPSVPENKHANWNAPNAASDASVAEAASKNILSKYQLKAEGSFTPTAVTAVNASVKPNVPLPAVARPSATTVTQPDGQTYTVPTDLKAVVDYLNAVNYDELAEWKYLFLSGRLGCLDLKTDVMQQLADLNDRYYNGHFRLRIIKALDQLSKPDNVKAFKKENTYFKEVIDSLKRVNTNNQQALKAFDNAISGDIYKLLLNRPPLTVMVEKAATKKAAAKNAADTKASVDTQTELCTAFITYSQIVFKRMVRACLDGQRKRDQMLDLADRLANEIAATESLIDETFSDREGSYKPQNALIIGRYSIHDDRMHEVGILIRKRLFDFNTEPPTLSATSEKLYGRIRIRSSQTLIPEFSFGVYFTNLTYPVYNIKTLTAQQATDLNASPTRPTATTYAAGQTIVDEVVQQPIPIVAAAMLNLTLKAFNGLAHPMVQLGVGTGRTLPTFLLGGGIRLRGSVPIMVSAGAIWRWKKQLMNLRDSQVIDGQAQLENDLQTVFDPKPRFYIGIQMHL